MNEFIEIDEVNKNNKFKTEFDKLTQEAGLGYTDFLLENLDKLSKHGFEEAKQLLDELNKLKKVNCTMRLGISDIIQFERELNTNYWIDFRLYGYSAMCNYILYNGDIIVTDDTKALDLIYKEYRKNPENIVYKIEQLVRNEKSLYELSKSIRIKIIKEHKNDVKKEAISKISNFKMSDLDSILKF